MAPAGTWTVVGTANAVLVPESDTLAPPGGAGVAIETVQPILPLTNTVVGEQERPVKRGPGALMVTVAVTAFPPAAAVTVAVWLVDGVPAVAVKLALVTPATTVAEAGTVKAALSEERVTSRPDPDAGLFSVTVHIEVVPAGTVAGLQVSEAGVTGLNNDSEAVAEPPFRVDVS